MLRLAQCDKFIEKYHLIFLLFILIISYIFRFKGIDFQLPFLYDEDESRRVNQAFQMLVRGDPNPRWFGHPASTLLYLLAVVDLIIFFFGSLLGHFPDFQAFQNLYYQDPTIFYLTGRFVLIAIGTATVFMTYLVAHNLFNPTVGIIASILVAFSPLHIKYSKIIRSDVLMVLLLLIAFFYCVKISQEKEIKNYILAGVFTGAAITTKYPAIIASVSIVIAHLVQQNWRFKETKKLLISARACLASAFITSPFLFLNFSRALNNIKHESRSSNVGANGEGLIPNLIWYLQNSLLNNLTFWGILLLTIGLMICLIKRSQSQLLLISFPIIFSLFICSLSLRWDRWLIPLIPFSAIIIAFAVYQLAQWLENITRKPLALGLILICLGLIITPLIEINQVEFRELSGLDTRTLAREWIINNIPHDSSILVDENPPPLSSKKFNLFEIKKGKISPIEASKNRHDFVGPEIKSLAEIKDLTQIKSHQLEYVIISWKYFKYLEEANKYPQEIKNYQEIISQGQLIHEIKREGKITSGPTVQIYQFKAVI